MTARRLLFLTGTRADFGKLEPLAIAARDAGHEVTFFVTGMHMLEKYGLTRNEVQRLPGVVKHEFINQRQGDPQDIILSKTILGLSDWVHENRPDLTIVHGDRIEALAGALVCATNYIRCAHIEGGEVSGTIDEVYRHCNTKLCTYHFVSSEAAKARVLTLGEEPETVFNIGSPELDFHGGPSGVTLDEVRNHYAIPFKDYGIAVFHPVTSERDTIGAQAHSLFSALSASGRSFIVISPNNDPGSEDIFAEIEKLDPARFRHLPNMRFAYFSELMKNAAAIIGNSSAGVREAPFLGIPSLNLGTRQLHRSVAPSITETSAFDRDAIADFLTNRWGQRFASDRSFGQGNSAARFAGILNTDGFWSAPLQKHFYSAE
ncbi:Polysialic acid biosynthesis protein P7 [Pannonibacter phragmitetus]|uniref:Polysialic acid biosynthesis protein P7 n=1 Tax=Pannonibacter phragmitetus TaxID=121719 RepID=A0A378ZT00_9HYPH|nr:UDP-N-acetylglucosamine 2-epimerase [Pannonibacter phragmitetus]SUB00372.1 Polysialic acid biosynthesis protein P7 [Pannonibacter phragmitetus]